MSATQFDLFVIGTGPAASRAALRCRAEGWSVAVADSRGIGGTCALRGCNPKKVLVRAAELLDWVRRSDGELISAADARIDWRQLIRFKRTFTEPVTPKSKENFTEKGVEIFEETVGFEGPTTLRAGDRLIEARHILVATGAAPSRLNIPGEEHLTTSDEFLETDDLPARLVFVGGGYITFEFAHVAARAGAHVTILQHDERPLKRFDRDLVARLVDATREGGIAVELNSKAVRIEKSDDGNLAVVASNGDGERRFEADMAVHGAGRSPNIGDLNLEAGDVEYGQSGVKVNEYMQSVSNPAVYAAGDVVDVDRGRLTPVANQQSRTAAMNMLEGNQHRPDYGAVPSAVFSVPALASVGLTEEAAASEGRDFEVHEGDMTDWGSYRKIGSPAAGYRILVEKETEAVLGAHLLGPDAAETINLFALAMKFDLKASDVKSVLFTFPTFAANVRSML